MRTGDPARELYLIVEGQVSLRLPDGRRLATLTAGMTFGERSVLDDASRVFDAVADEDVELAVLDAAHLRALHEENPALEAVLLRNLLAGAYDHIARAAAEVASLGGTERATPA